jgi:hypothetical protein
MIGRFMKLVAAESVTLGPLIGSGIYRAQAASLPGSLLAGAAKVDITPAIKSMMVTLADGNAGSGYIPDDQSFSHETFEVLSSRLKPGCAEDGITDGLLGLMSGSMNH